MGPDNYLHLQSTQHHSAYFPRFGIKACLGDCGRPVEATFNPLSATLAYDGLSLWATWLSMLSKKNRQSQVETGTVSICFLSPKGSKNPEVPSTRRTLGPKEYSSHCSWDSTPSYLGTWALWKSRVLGMLGRSRVLLRILGRLRWQLRGRPANLLNS